jgi:leucyl aminopeptidase
MSNEQLEFNVGDDEKPATVTINDEDGQTELSEKESAVEVRTEDARGQETELDDYSDKVKKRIDKLTARLRETQRREQAAIEYAQQVQRHAQELEKKAQQIDVGRLDEAKTRIETQAIALNQIIKAARQEGDVETEMEAQRRLTDILMDQRQVSEQAAMRQAQLAAAQQQAQYQQQAPQQVAAPSEPDPRAEEWAERNEWFGSDVAMTAAVRGIHMQLVSQEGFDPKSNEYYDELDRRMRDAFPHRLGSRNSTQPSNRTTRPVQVVAPAARASGANNARRTVRLTPSQVAIAKRLGVSLEEYAKHVKD